MNKTVYKLSVVLSTLLVSTSLFAGEDATNNPIETGVSFLNIAPESRGSSLGDAGAATSPDVYSQYWNPAKYPFVKDEFGLGFSYTPWLRSLVNDIGLVDVTGFLRFDEYQTVSSSIRYFSMGDIQITDASGSDIDYGNIHPYELAVDFAYSRKFSDNWAGAVAFRYILSDIFNGSSGGEGGQVYAANSFAVDISSYYHKEDVYVAGYQSNYSFGLNVSNLGRKLTYNKGDTRYFLPANLKLGGAYGVDIDNYNSLMFTVDLNKLLVPTPDPSIDDDDNEYYNNMSSLEGVFKSFSDAPDGFSEEMREIMVSVGLEYVYDNTFAVRGGYFYENQYKGNREYFSLGAGFKMNVFSLDVSYLVPMDSASPLANTLRFSLSFGVDGIQKMFR